MKKLALLLFVIILLVIVAVSTVFAASSVIITPFGTTSGSPTGLVFSGVVDDGSECDAYAIMFTDATGQITDIDVGCALISSGEATAYNDPGSYETGYINTTSPITISVFDIEGSFIDYIGEVCFEEGENSIACGEYLLSGAAVCIGEIYHDATDLTPGSPFPVCGSLASGECRLNVPSGSVVGDMPLGAQAYYAPGLVAPEVVINPGTYLVIGQDESETYYKIVLACQYLWVRKDTMQPSFQAPQNGEPLPTRIVS